MSDRHLSGPVSSEAPERELFQLGAVIAYPATPDIAASIAGALESQSITTRQRIDRRLLWVAIAAALLVFAALVSSSTAREPFSRLLHLPGIRVIVRNDGRQATPLPTPTLPDVGLGREVALNDAIQIAPFLPSIPDPEVYGVPDEVLVLEPGSGATLVSFVYLPDEHLPAPPETGAGMILMEFVSGKDTLVLTKEITGDGTMHGLSVAEDAGFWIEGTSELSIVGADPEVPGNSTTRETANALIWRHDGVSYRLETSLDKNEARAIAESLQPAS